MDEWISDFVSVFPHIHLCISLYWWYIFLIEQIKKLPKFLNKSTLLFLFLAVTRQYFLKLVSSSSKTWWSYIDTQCTTRYGGSVAELRYGNLTVYFEMRFFTNNDYKVLLQNEKKGLQEKVIVMGNMVSEAKRETNLKRRWVSCIRMFILRKELL